MYNKTKEVTWKNIQKGMPIYGYKLEGNHSSLYGTVTDLNPAYVTVKIGDYEDRIDSNVMFLVEMPDDEFRSKYNTYAGVLVKAVQTKMSRDELGPHDMYNGWISADPWLMAERCINGGITILGHCTDIPEKPGFDIGLCAEDNGERFWCHYSSDVLEQLIKGYGIYQDLMKRGLQWMYSHEMGKLIEQQIERKYGGDKS